MDFSPIKKLAYQTFIPAGLPFDLPLNPPVNGEQYKQRKHADRLSTRVLTFLGFPAEDMTGDQFVDDRRKNALSILENFFRNLIGWHRQASGNQKIWNAIKLPVVLLWNVGTVPVRLTVNLLSVVTVLIPGILSIAMDSISKKLSGKMKDASLDDATASLAVLTNLWILARGFYFLLEVVGFVGRAVFAPSLGMYKANEFGRNVGGKRGTLLSVLLITLSTLITLAAYTLVFPLAIQGIVVWAATYALPSVVVASMQAVQAAYVWGLAKLIANMPFTMQTVISQVSVLGSAVNFVMTQMGLTMSGGILSPLVLGISVIAGAVSGLGLVVAGSIDLIKNKINEDKRPIIKGEKKIEMKKEAVLEQPYQPVKPLILPNLKFFNVPLPKPQAVEKKPVPEKQKPVKEEKNIDYSALHLKEKLGEGGFGVVYKATYRGELVAVKKPNRNAIVAVDEFEREAELMGKLNSPYVISYLGACVQQPNLCLVMEFMEKGSLDGVLRNANPRIPIGGKLYLKYAEYMTRGMVYLHKNGIIHTDLKSLNVLVNKNDECKITDFGISKFKPLGNSTLIGPTYEGGTPLWQAPELFEPGKKADDLSDMYSLGTIYWELAETKYPPMHKKPEDINEKTSAAMRALIMRCWSERRENRRPRAGEALEVIVSEQKRDLKK